jgi:ribonucleoside-diphosphate reductase alpha chain
VSKANGPQHERLPRLRRGRTHSLVIDDFNGYLITGEYEDGSLGQIFLYVAKQGSTLRGVFDCWATAVSLGLQHGVPLESYVEKYVGQHFEPFGMTGDTYVDTVSSVSDYIFRLLAFDYLDDDTLARLNLKRPAA